MHNFIELAKEEVPQLENALKKIDVFLNRAPEGCLKWQNKKGKTYYYHHVVLQIIYSFMLHFIYNHFQDYPKCHITLFKPDYAHKILLSKNEAHYLTRMRLLTARTFGFSVTYD